MKYLFLQPRLIDGRLRLRFLPNQTYSTKSELDVNINDGLNVQGLRELRTKHVGDILAIPERTLLGTTQIPVGPYYKILEETVFAITKDSTGFTEINPVLMLHEKHFPDDVRDCYNKYLSYCEDLAFEKRKSEAMSTTPVIFFKIDEYSAKYKVLPNQKVDGVPVDENCLFYAPAGLLDHYRHDKSIIYATHGISYNSRGITALEKLAVIDDPELLKAYQEYSEGVSLTEVEEKPTDETITEDTALSISDSPESPELFDDPIRVKESETPLSTITKVFRCGHVIRFRDGSAGLVICAKSTYYILRVLDGVYKFTEIKKGWWLSLRHRNSEHLDIMDVYSPERGMRDDLTDILTDPKKYGYTCLYTRKETRVSMKELAKQLGCPVEEIVFIP